MALTQFTEDTGIIAALSNTPNSSDGLTATQLKAKFDENSANLKTYINDTLIDELDTHIASALTASSAFGTDNVILRSDGTGRGVQSTGIVITDIDDMKFGDNNYIVLGDDSDAWLYYSSTDTYLLDVANTPVHVSHYTTTPAPAIEEMIVATPGGSVDLYHDAVKKLSTTATGINVQSESTPATAGATGTKGDIRWDADYIYVCVATDTWKRAAISTW